MKIFVSHSGEDASLAEAVVVLLKDALRLRASDIRCTSVEGYRLPAGADIDKTLQAEVTSAEALLGIVSNASLKSAYVAFELGARWGAGRYMVPLLAPGLDASALAGPIGHLNALRLASPAQLHQLVGDVADHLHLDPEPAASYQRWVDRIIAIGTDLPSLPASASNVGMPTSRLDSFELPSDENIRSEIKRFVAEQHPNDYATQIHVVKQQMKAWLSLRQLRPKDIPADVIEALRAQAADSHPGDYSVQLHVLKSQLEGWTELNS